MTDARPSGRVADRRARSRVSPGARIATLRIQRSALDLRDELERRLGEDVAAPAHGHRPQRAPVDRDRERRPQDLARPRLRAQGSGGPDRAGDPSPTPAAARGRARGSRCRSSRRTGRCRPRSRSFGRHPRSRSRWPRRTGPERDAVTRVDRADRGDLDLAVAQRAADRQLGHVGVAPARYEGAEADRHHETDVRSRATQRRSMQMVVMAVRYENQPRDVAGDIGTRPDATNDRDALGQHGSVSTWTPGQLDPDGRVAVVRDTAATRCWRRATLAGHVARVEARAVCAHSGFHTTGARPRPMRTAPGPRASRSQTVLVPSSEFSPEPAGGAA